MPPPTFAPESSDEAIAELNRVISVMSTLDAFDAPAPAISIGDDALPCLTYRFTRSDYSVLDFIVQRYDLEFYKFGDLDDGTSIATTWVHDVRVQVILDKTAPKVAA